MEVVRWAGLAGAVLFLGLAVWLTGTESTPA